VLLTTQYLDEADALADSIVFIDAGQVVAAGTPAELKEQSGQAQFDLIAATDADVVRLTAALGALAVVTDQARRAVRVAVQGSGLDGIRELNAITGAAVRAGASIERFSVREPDLDDVYFRLTGHARPARAAGGAT
jgi:ABC-type multidrug transport system ATPase subunit